MSFFFSSRRRHTRWPRDWSSDVCSSDLVDVIGFCLPADQKIGPGDRFIAEDLAELRRGRRGPKVIAIVTKTDLVGRRSEERGAGKECSAGGGVEGDEV